MNFFVAQSSLDFSIKLGGFIICLILFIFGLLVFFWRNNLNTIKTRENSESQKIVIQSSNENKNQKLLNDEQEKLASLKEITHIFGSSLNSQDTFRLISNRIAEIIPYSACVVYFSDESGNLLSAELFAGERGNYFNNFLISNNNGLVGKSFALHKPIVDQNVVLEKALWNEFASGIAAPLADGENCFGVLALYSNVLQKYQEHTSLLLSEIAKNVAELLQKSFAVEKNIENSLTDSLTELPNQRAFYLVLEQQIAESLRYREVRQLSILSIDIKDFTDLNMRFGPYFGDHILTLTATVIRNQLRQMDFLSRFSNDEFMAILPTAPKDIAEKISNRIKNAVESFSIETPEKEDISIELNLGYASFLFDGETAFELVQSARHRKEKAKINSMNPLAKVLNFPVI